MVAGGTSVTVGFTTDAATAVPVVPAVTVPIEVTTLTVAVLVPVALGLKLTEMLHDPPTASEVPQVFVRGKSVALVPVIVIEVMVSVAVPGLESVTVCVALVDPTFVEANVSEVGDNTALATPTPVPVRATVWWPVMALSVTVSVAGSEPTAVGLNVTEIVQLVATASVVPHVVVSK